jgi:hypothetical protein
VSLKVLVWRLIEKEASKFCGSSPDNTSGAELNGTGMMNETVYLFALSLPDLLEQIVANDQFSAVPHIPAPTLTQASAPGVVGSNAGLIAT